MRGFFVWLLAIIVWNLILWAGRGFGVYPTFGETMIAGAAGSLSMFVIAMGDEA